MLELKKAWSKLVLLQQALFLYHVGTYTKKKKIKNATDKTMTLWLTLYMG
jgi:hypothetical protein